MNMLIKIPTILLALLLFTLWALLWFFGIRECSDYDAYAHSRDAFGEAYDGECLPGWEAEPDPAWADME